MWTLKTNKWRTGISERNSVCLVAQGGQASYGMPLPGLFSQVPWLPVEGGQADPEKTWFQQQQQACRDMKWGVASRADTQGPEKGPGSVGEGRERMRLRISGRWLGLYFPCGPERGTFPEDGCQRVTESGLSPHSLYTSNTCQMNSTGKPGAIYKPRKENQILVENAFPGDGRFWPGGLWPEGP